MANIDLVGRSTQARGRLRRAALLDAARALLECQEVPEVTLPTVAEKAGIPLSSTYHFFADMTALLKALAGQLSREMLVKTVPPIMPRDWTEIVAGYVASGASSFNRDVVKRKLLLGPNTSAEIRRAGCEGNPAIGNGLRSLIKEHFVIPAIDDEERVFFRAILIGDLMFCLSQNEHRRITDAYVLEAINASIAYLKLYLPPILCSRELTSVKQA